MSKVQTLKEFEQSDKVVGYVFEIARNVVSRPGDFNSIDWLIKRGSLLSGYYAYLESKANEALADYEVADVTYKSVRDGLMIGLKNDKSTITEAKAEATRELVEAEVDVIAKRNRAKNYATSARVCDRIVSFIQSTLRHKEREQTTVHTAERGN